MKLTQENYYGPEANKEFMSKSQFRSWQTCEAATLAEINGEYERETTQALLVGSYIDAAMDSPEELQKFLEEHPEILNSRTGELKADFKQAEQIVARCKSDRLFSLLTGNAPETKDHVQRQVILIGKVGGVKFRGKADFVLDETACKVIMEEFPDTVDVLGGPFCVGAIVDLKSAKDFAPVWDEDEGRKVNWADAYGYASQGGLYVELYRQMTGKALPFIMVAATKEKEPDLGAFYIAHNDLAAALRTIEVETPMFQRVKTGKVEPIRCERCAYCKRTKKLTGMPRRRRCRRWPRTILHRSRSLRITPQRAGWSMPGSLRPLFPDWRGPLVSIRPQPCGTMDTRRSSARSWSGPRTSSGNTLNRRPCPAETRAALSS